jgi:hypothetical protein
VYAYGIFLFLVLFIEKGVIMKKSFLALCLFGAAFVGSQAAYAATQSVTANIEFATAITFVKDTDIDFGIVEAGVASVYGITTGGVVSVVSGTGTILGGAPTAADVNIIGSGTQTINISVTIGAPAGGVTIQNPVCDYNNAGSGTCTINNATAPGASPGRAILIGAEANVDGTQASGATAAPTLTLNVVYS